MLGELKADPGQISLDSLLAEVDKLERIRSLGLPAGLFAGAPDPVVGAWRARAALEYPSDLRERPRPVRLTLLAVLCWTRTGEITDGLVELLIGIVHRIGTRAENRVEGELLADLRRVRGKEGILFRLAEAAVEHPDDTVRTALYPVVSEATLRDLVKEAKATEAVFKTRVRKALRSSYSSYYRRMLPRLLGALQFRSNNSAHRPVIEALDLLGRYAGRPATVRFYAGAETVPLAGVVPADWETAVVDERGRVERIPYELCVLRACVTGCAAARYGWRAPTAGGTPRRTCPPTSRSAARSTTPLCVSPSTLPRSSTSSAAACAPPWPASTLRSARMPPAGCALSPGGASVDHRPPAGQAPRAGQPGPPQGPGRPGGGAPSTCSTS